jgi:hypothetical protein
VGCLCHHRGSTAKSSKKTDFWKHPRRQAEDTEQAQVETVRGEGVGPANALEHGTY